MNVLSVQTVSSSLTSKSESSKTQRSLVSSVVLSMFMSCCTSNDMGLCRWIYVINTQLAWCCWHISEWWLAGGLVKGRAPCGARAPLFPLVHLLPHLFRLFYFSLSLIGFTYFLLLSIPSLSTRIVPLCFQAGGRRRRPNLVLFFNLCYLYSLLKIWIEVFCSILFSLILCVFLQCFDTVRWVIWPVKTCPRYDL